MTMPRIGCGDEPFYVTEPNEQLCEHCGMRTDLGCVCAPCDDCAEVFPDGALNWGRDNRGRCAACHLRAETKILAGEHPVIREEDWRQTAGGVLVHTTLLVAALVVWLGGVL